MFQFRLIYMIITYTHVRYIQGFDNHRFIIATICHEIIYTLNFGQMGDILQTIIINASFWQDFQNFDKTFTKYSIYPNQCYTIAPT